MLLIYKTILTSKKQLVNNVYLFTFDLIDPSEINFIPGQYLMTKIPTNKGPVSRLYSIASSSSEKNSFELIVQIIPGGLASSYLSNLKVKDEVVFQGPAGMFSLKKSNRPKIFLATGTGIAPVRSMLNSEFRIQNSEFFLFWGLKTYRDVYLLDELKQFNLKICLSREKNLNMIPEADRKYFELGHIDKCFEKQFNNEAIKQWNNYEFYLCGRREIVDSLKNFLISKNIPQENIVFEKF